MKAAIAARPRPRSGTTASKGIGAIHASGQMWFTPIDANHIAPVRAIASAITTGRVGGRPARAPLDGLAIAEFRRATGCLFRRTSFAFALTYVVILLSPCLVGCPSRP